MTEIFIRVIEMSVTASIVIGIIFFLRLILRKAPKVFSYALWAAALFRLLCPISFELPSAPIPNIDMSYMNEFAERSAENLFITDMGNATISEYSEPQTEAHEEFTAVPDTVEEPAKKEISIIAIASYIWELAVMVMALRGVVSWIRLSRSLRFAQKMGGNVYVSPAISDPFIMGIIRPKIYLPTGLNCTESDLIIRHEKAHMHRGDHIAKLVMYAALCIHCFNPLVWVMFRLFERDMEMSCDEKVTANMTKDEKSDYSQTLLKTASRPMAAFTACFGENGTKQRIKNVLSFKKPAVWVVIVLTVAAVAVSIFLCADRKTDNGTDNIAITSTAENEKTTILTTVKEQEIKESIPEMPTNFEVFSGTEKDAAPLNTINNKEFSPSVFCYDNDTVYFSWKGSVYSYNEADNALEELFKANAYSLNYYNGKLYYIENNDYVISRNITFVDGPLFCYDLNDGSNKIICDNNISMPVVSDDGIFYVKYSVEGDPLPTGVYKLNEESGKSERVCNGFSYIEYNDLKYSYLPGNSENNQIRFYFTNGDNALLLDNIRSRKESLYGDDMYYISRDDGSLNRLSMLTGENTVKIIYNEDFFNSYYPDMADTYASAGQQLSLSDYTVFNDEIWFYGIGLNRYDEVENRIVSHYANFTAHSLYSSNNAMYAVISETVNGMDVFHFAKISINGNTAEAKILK